MRRSLFGKQNSISRMLSADEFHGPINAFMDRHLADTVFIRPKQGVWAREHCLSGRPMFELRHYKGAVSDVVWGLALNYVPHFNNTCTKLYWHRTIKSARIDVFPFDDVEKTQGLSRITTPAKHAVAVESVLATTIEQGMEFFGRHQSMLDLPPLFDRLERHRGRGLGYWNYSNLPVAHAFTLRVLGDSAPGMRILDKFAQRNELSGPPLADLMNRFEQATADPVLF